MNEERLAATFVQLADTLVADFDLVEFLHQLVEQCVGLLDVSAAGLMLADVRGRLHVMASSTENVRLLELFQLQNDDGPCLECYRTATPVSDPDLAAARARWPRFAPAALEAGFRTVHALPMRLRDQTVGALNLFHAEPNELGHSVTRIGQAMVDVATIGLIQERTQRQHEILIDQLQAALDSRVLIEQAKGVLAARHGIDPNAALTVLRDYARSHNRRLTALATAVIDGSAPAELLAGVSAPPAEG